MSIAFELMSALRLEDGRRWGEAAVPIQVEDALAVLEGAAPYNWLGRSRGFSKTTDNGALAIPVLLTATGRLRADWLAADRDQASLAIDVISGFVHRSPVLRERLVVQAGKVIATDTGATLEILSADAASAWGRIPHWVFCDELANWPDTPNARRLWEAVSSALAKRADARLVVITTASSPDHWSFKILEHARTSALWRVSEQHGPPPWMDSERLEEQRRRLPDAAFRQLFLNEWTAAEGTLLDAQLVDQMFRLDGPGDPDPSCSYVAGLDLGRSVDPSVLALGHRRHDGTVLLDRLVVSEGSKANPVDFDEVERAIAAVHRRLGSLKVFLDPWQAFQMSARLRERGVDVNEFTFSVASKQRLAQVLIHSVNSGGLLVYEADGLRDELKALRLVQTSAGAWAFDHARGRHDDRAVAVSLMLLAALSDETGPVWGSASVPGGGWSDAGGDGEPEFGTPDYEALSYEERRELCDQRAGIASGPAPAFAISPVDPYREFGPFG